MDNAHALSRQGRTADGAAVSQFGSSRACARVWRGSLVDMVF